MHSTVAFLTDVMDGPRHAIMSGDSVLSLSVNMHFCPHFLCEMSIYFMLCYQTAFACQWHSGDMVSHVA